MRAYSYLILLFVFIFLIISAGNCTKEKVQEEPLTIALNIWPGYGAFFIAQEKNFYEEENVEVNIEIIQGDPEREAALMSGQIDGIGMTLDNLVILRDKGINVKAIFKYDDSFGADGIVAKKDIKTISDLKGKNVAWAPATTSHFFLTQVLIKFTMSTKDLNHIAMSSDDGGAAFAAGKIDAAVTWEPWLSKANEMEDGHILISTKDIPVIEDVLFLRSEVLNKRREYVKKFLRACFKAIEYWKSHPDEGNQIISKHLKIPVKDIEDMLSGIRIMDLNDNLSFFGTLKKPGPIYQAYDNCVDAWINEGVINKKTSSSEGIESYFINKLNE